MMPRGLACEGRRRRHKYNDQHRDQRSHRTSTGRGTREVWHGGPTLEGEARRRARQQSRADAADQSDRTPGSEAPPAQSCRPALRPPSSRRSARIVQNYTSDPFSNLTPRRSQRPVYLA
jgi:hypothetical protein